MFSANADYFKNIFYFGPKFSEEMKRYNTTSGRESNIVSYDVGNDYIIIEYSDSKKFKYSHNSAGAMAVETMKVLAKNQNGLTTYITEKNPGFEKWYRP